MRYVDILAFRGRLDGTASLAVIEEIAAQGESRIVLNVKGLESIDDAGLGQLMQLRKRLVQTTGEMVLSEPSGPFEERLATWALEDAFRLFENDNAALEYFGGDDGAAGVVARLIPIQPADSARAQAPSEEAP